MKIKKFSQLSSKRRIVLVISVVLIAFIVVFSVGRYTGLWAMDPGNGGGDLPVDPPPGPTITLPNPPELQTITPKPDIDGTISLIWSVVSNAESYEVYMSIDDGTSWNLIKATSTIGCVHRLTNGYYEFKVRAYNSEGYSGYSNVESVIVAIPEPTPPPPPPPEPEPPEKPVMNQLTYEIIGDTIIVYIDWNEVDCDSYNVYKSVDYMEYNLIIMEVVLTSTSYSENLTDVGAYRYKVTAINEHGESEFSERVLIEITEEGVNPADDYTMVFVLIGVFGVIIVAIILFRKRIMIKR